MTRVAFTTHFAAGCRLPVWLTGGAPVPIPIIRERVRQRGSSPDEKPTTIGLDMERVLLVLVSDQENSAFGTLRSSQSEFFPAVRHSSVRVPKCDRPRQALDDGDEDDFDDLFMFMSDACMTRSNSSG